MHPIQSLLALGEDLFLEITWEMLAVVTSKNHVLTPLPIATSPGVKRLVYI